MSGGLDDWPAGDAQYVYGALFHQYLAQRYGPGSIGQLTGETARRLPYLGAPAFRAVYGRSLGQLWSDFGAAMEPTDADEANVAGRITSHGFTVSGPRFSADGRLYYSRRGPDDFPALMALDPAATHPVRVTTRYLGEGVAPAGTLLIFDQMDFTRNVALQSDLYAFSTVSAQTSRLTTGLRAGDPDASPDGRSLVFTRQRADRRELATARLVSTPHLAAEGVQTLLSEPDTELASPRWSPDGRAVAAERHVLGRLPEIVIVDVSTRAVRVVASGAGSRNVSPQWTPDGRRLIFASARGELPFQLFLLDLESGASSRLQGTGPSARSPAVSPDGQTLVFVGYTADGYDLFSLPLGTARWLPDSERSHPTGSPSGAGPAQADAPASNDWPYAPWRTLLPRYWTPSAASDGDEATLGAATAGADALGRHTYLADLRWSLSRVRPDWHASYVYDRWWPSLFVDAADDTDPYRAGTSQSVEINAGALLPWRHVRWSQSLLVGFHAATDRLDCPACSTPVSARADRRSLRGGWSFASARTYAYSISREEGWSMTATNELVLGALGAAGDAGSAALDVRRYARLGGPHAVLAVRAASAHAWGDDTVRREFRASGDGQPGGFLFGSDAVGLLRGFDDEIRGRHAAVVNVDCRFPIARVERGAGTWPAFARTVHGAVFVDVGHAWDRSVHRRDLRVSSGAELSLDAVLGYGLPVTLTGGAAWLHDPGGVARGVAVFARIGRAF